MRKNQYIFVLILFLSYCSFIQTKAPLIFKQNLKSSLIDINVLAIYWDPQRTANVIGWTGVLPLHTNYTRDEDEYEIFDKLDNNKIPFVAVIKDQDGADYQINCRLEIFKKFTDEELIVLCEFDNNTIPGGNYSVQFDNQFFNEEFDVNFYVHSSDKFDFIKVDYYITNLYSSDQNIEVDENKDEIEIKFTIFSYNNDHLFLYKESNSAFISLDDCKQVDHNLKCVLKKDKLLGILSSSHDSFILHYIDNNYKDNTFNLVGFINITYNNVEKEDVFVEIIRPAESTISLNKYFGYKTNVTNISEIQIGFNSFSMNFKYVKKSYCSFRKFEGNPLLIICYEDEDSIAILQDIEDEIILDNINIKYNFRIQPVNNIDQIRLSFSNPFRIALAFPKVLDFTNQDSVTVDFYGNSLSYKEGLRLNQRLSGLNCEILGDNHYLRCIVPKSHFKGRKSGYFFLVYDENWLAYDLFFEIPPFEVILNESSIEVDIIVDDIYDRYGYVGKKGAVVMTTDFKDEDELFNSSDIESKTNFTIQITSWRYYEIEIECRLVKLTGEPILVFCELGEENRAGPYYIDFDNVILRYNNVQIILNTEYSLVFTKSDVDKPQLYYDYQKIKVEENKESIEIKFKIISYNNEKIFFVDEYFAFEPLDNCKEKDKELTCFIQKDKLLEIMQDSRVVSREVIIIDNNNLVNYCYLVKEIEINYYGIQKEDVFVGITKLIENKFDVLKGITYETNVTNISNVLMGFQSFPMIFGNFGNIHCFFRKYEDSPLLLICFWQYFFREEDYLMEIDKEIILDYINIKYNFRIQPVKINDKFYFDESSECYFPFIYYPKILDFTSQNEWNITFIGNMDKYPGIRLNMDEEDLECEISEDDDLSYCLISKSHFKGKKSGFYYIIHVNEFNEKVTFYEIPPIKVVLNESEEEEEEPEEEQKDEPEEEEEEYSEPEEEEEEYFEPEEEAEEEQLEPEEGEHVEPEEEEHVEPEEEEHVEPEEEEEHVEPEEEEEHVEPEEEEHVEPEEEEEHVEPEEEEHVEPEEEEHVEPEEEEHIEPEEEEHIEPEEEEHVEPEEEEEHVEPEEEEEGYFEPEEEEKEEESKDEEREEYEESEEERHEKEEEEKSDREGEKEEEEESDNDEHRNNGGKKSSSTKTILIIVFSIFGGILLLVGIFLLYRFLRKKKVTRIGFEVGASNRQLLETQELKE